MVQDQVRKEIIDGSLSPGERLTETNLADRFDVSRTPVREALVRLQADGFVELVRNRGAFVSKWTESLLRAHIQSGRAIMRRASADGRDLPHR